MRKWCKQLGVLGGCLLGLGGTFNPVGAQFGAGPPAGGGMFAGDPQRPMPPDFPNPGKGSSDPVSPFSVREDGAPNAFSILEGPPPNNAYHMTFRTEYLGWWVSPMKLANTLVTGTAANPLVAGDNGALGQPSTQALFGPGDVNYSIMSGGRITFGLAPGFVPPLEFSGFAIGRSQTLFAAASAGDVNLFRPVQLANAATILGTPAQGVIPIAGPAFGSGSIAITNRLSLWGVDADMFYNLTDNGVVQFDLIGGYKYLDLSDRFNVTQNSLPNVAIPFPGITGGVLPAGIPLNLVDDFFTRNQFNGGTVGLRSRLLMGPFMLLTDAKLSMGSTYQYLSVFGATTAGGTLQLPGGVLAQTSNIGISSRHSFSLVPEATATLSYQVTPNLRLFAGYNVLYWTRVVRAAEQASTALDPRQAPLRAEYVPGTSGSAPGTFFSSRGFFAHGFSGGLEFGF